MSERIRVAIAGYGDTGKKRAAAINNHDGFDLIAVSDKNERAAYDSYVKIIDADLNLDALFVCLPNYLAAKATIMGLEKGCHVFCEKPPAKSLEDLADVGKIAKERPDQVLMYGFNHRLHDSIIDTKILIDTDIDEILWMRGVYGKSRLTPFHSNWRSKRELAGGGVLLDQGIHMLDLIRLFGGEFDDISAFVSRAYHDADVEDNVMAILRNDKIMCGVHSSAILWEHKFSLDIGMKDKVISLSGILSGTKSYGEETLTVSKFMGNIGGQSTKEVTRYFVDKSWKREIDEFYRAITTGNRGNHGLIEDARKSMELVFKIYEADKSWNSIDTKTTPDTLVKK